MFEFGFSEMVLIGLIALIVLGPKRLPEVARTAGQWVGKIRRFVENVKRDIDAEIKDEDLAAFKQMHAELNETRNLLQKSATETFSGFAGGMNESSAVAESPALMEGPGRTTETAAQSKPPASKARRPAVRKTPKAPAKTAIKAVRKKAATKTNRATHGGVKKT